MEKTAGADFHAAVRQDVLQEPAETLHDVQGGGAWACAAHFPGGEGDGTVLEAHDAPVGESGLEDRGGEGGAGGVAVRSGLTMPVPGEGPALGVALLQQTSVAPLFFAERPGDGREGCDGAKAGGAGGAPGRAVLREAPPRDDRVDMGMIRELPPPRMQDPGAPREVRADAARVGGQPLERRGRRLQQGLVREALR